MNVDTEKWFWRHHNRGPKYPAKNRIELKRDRSCRRSAWLGRLRHGWTLVPSDAGRAFLVVSVSHNCRAPLPNCGFCGFKVR
eukprot:5574777-Prymnesium_polylepis.1